MDKISKPEAGYQNRGVRKLPATPSMTSSQVTNPPRGGPAPTEYGGLPIAENTREGARGHEGTEAILD